jgi:hypothetical protein
MARILTVDPERTRGLRKVLYWTKTPAGEGARAVIKRAGVYQLRLFPYL